MGILSKLFRKKKSTAVDGGEISTTNASKSSSKKSRKSSSKKKDKESKNNNNNTSTAATGTGTGTSKVLAVQHPQPPTHPNNSAAAAAAAAAVRKQPPIPTMTSSVITALRRPSSSNGNTSTNSSIEPSHGGTTAITNAATTSVNGGVRVLSPRNNHLMSGHHPYSLSPVKHHSSPIDNNNNNSITATARNNTAAGGGAGGWGTGPVDLDESDFASESDENQIQAMYNKHQQQRLSVQQLHRFDMQQHQNNNNNNGHQFYMPKEELTRFSAGHVPVTDDMNRSDASSSSFNLSTDAEDTEYEDLKRRGVIPNHGNGNRHHHQQRQYPHNTTTTTTTGGSGSSSNNNTNLDSSHLSGVSSPTNYNTDGDNSIFPALHTDDEGTLTDRDSQVGGGGNILPSHHAPTTDDDEEEEDDPLSMGTHRGGNSNTHHGQRQQQQMVVSKSRSSGGGVDDDERAWTVSPTKDGTNPFDFPTSPKQQQQLQQHRNLSSPKNGTTTRSPTSFTTSALTVTNQKKTSSTSDAFANFADFSNVTFPADNESWGITSKDTPVSSPNSKKIVVDGTIPPLSPGGGNSNHHHQTSKPAAGMTLSDILAQAKGKIRNSSSSHRSTGSGGGGRHVSSSSVNSAPAITAKYLRQQHNLRGSSRHTSGGSAADHQDGTTPVSDIINSLEMANASRSSNASVGGNSQGKRQDISRAAKDRVKDRRRHSSSRRRSSDPNHTNESSDGSDQEGASDAWLFDEVTGALGPRGIAADLESLSGRSKSSTGNKSHKSHRSHRSHRSHGRSSGRRRKSGSKHHPSSGESVDSRGSRHSRSSRYSHRSTRSYLSQMSEQSRSVANDLLRLEMQLAMVGSQDNNGSGTVPGSSASVASRASRKSRSSTRRTVAIARRNKVTIQAPPGKLGIILANKADSKGTVVSGVRSSSVLSEKVSPGDRIVAIDGEDVSLMTVSEITTIMARKSDFERTLTVLTTPKHMTTMPNDASPSQAGTSDSRNGMVSPTKTKDYDSYHGHNRYSSSGVR